MRWTSWLSSLRTRRISVVGLDLGPDACCVVVLTGSQRQPDHVCCAERLELPLGWVVAGDVLQPEALGHWLRTYLQQGDYQPEWAYLGLDSACVSRHLVCLVAGLSPDDVAFQLQAAVQSASPDHASELCMDYCAKTEPAPLSESRYEVHVAPRARVEALQRVAECAGLKAAAVEPREEAIQRAERSHALAELPQASAALALPCDAAFGLALRAWHDTGVNFLPHRDDAQHALRRTWLLGVAACVIGGALSAAGFAMAMALVAERTRPSVTEVAASARAWDEVQKEYATAKAQQDRHTAHTRWLQARQDVQSQSLQWSRVLGHAAQGVWVASVQQQGTRWTVQGEALSAKHAQQLVQQLKALDIWAHAPELPQLQVMPAVSNTGLPVWQFRIEADLKVGV